MNAAVTASLADRIADRIADLGDIPQTRVRCEPPPGQATIDDLLLAQAADGRLYELVDGTLVEKAIGWQESMLAGVLLQWLNNFLDNHKLGVATGADGLSRLFTDTVRGPDVAFASWSRLPNGIPTQPIPDLVPDFVIEVLSVGNTRAEMARKRREYFHAGVRLLWIVDPRDRTVAVFSSPESFTIANEEAILDGADVLPGWQISLSDLFSRLDIGR